MLDQMYNDFVTKALPMIQEGLMITKEYFMDLFGRYVVYLLITDIIAAVVSLGFMFFFIFGTRKLIKIVKAEGTKERYTQDTDKITICMIGCVFSIVLTLVSFFCAWGFTEDAIKAKFIPEVRVWEEIQSMRPITASE